MIFDNTNDSTILGIFACDTIPLNGILAYYLLQGTAQDEMENFNGTEMGNIYVYDSEQGVVAHSTVGNSNHISIPALGSITNISISIWVKLSTSKGAGSLFYLTSGIGIYDTGANNTSILYNGVLKPNIGFTLPFDNLWHHYVLTNGVLYIDTQPVYTFTPIANPFTYSGLNIFGDGVSSFSFDDTSASNVVIYNRVISQTEVTQIYNVEKGVHNNPIDKGLGSYHPVNGDVLDNSTFQLDGIGTNVSYPLDATFGKQVIDTSLGSLDIPIVVGFLEQYYWENVGPGWVFVKTLVEKNTFTGSLYSDIRKYTRALSVDEEQFLQDYTKPNPTVCKEDSPQIN